MNSLFSAVETVDVRFPTSEDFAGSDAMHPEPDYSAAYLVIRTTDPDAPSGAGFAFTLGRGNEVQLAAIRALEGHLVGRPVDEVLADMGAFARELSGDNQLRWLGPEKGVLQMAVSAVVNAVWDLYAHRERKPLWKLLADLTPEAIVALVDFRYLGDVLTREEALTLMRERAAGKATREAHLLRDGYPAYTTSPGWLGYDDEKLERLCREAVAGGWNHVKIKVGRDIEDDVRRCRIARGVLGPNRKLMLDANQYWDADEAIRNMARLAEFDPRWIEEPTHPDDILGHAAIAEAIRPVLVATGEHLPNRVVFKQFLRAGAMGICQIDACRSGGVSEVIADLLLAAKYGIPVCPHAGGVGLCELVQHLAMFDYVAVSGTLDGRVIEYVDGLHEHFVDPVVVEHGHYRAPLRAGFSATMREASLARYVFPHGPAWRAMRKGQHAVR